jgi:RNA polymerase sigma-70 factor (ECF subfamily)
MGAEFGVSSDEHLIAGGDAVEIVRSHGDAELMDGIKRGDSLCFTELLRRYWTTIVAYSAVLVDPDTAEDVAQETFIRVAASASRWRPVGPVKRYLLHIARNVALNEGRRQRVRLSTLAAAKPDLLRRSVPTPAEVLDEREMRAAIQQVIQGMPERRREALALIRFAGFTYQEAAAIMGTSEQTIANQVSRALAAIRSAIEPLVDPTG